MKAYMFVQAFLKVIGEIQLIALRITSTMVSHELGKEILSKITVYLFLDSSAFKLLGNISSSNASVVEI